MSRDRKQGDVGTITGPPTGSINGREYDLTKFDMDDDLNDWIKLEIDLASGQPSDGAKSDAGATPAAATSKKSGAK